MTPDYFRREVDKKRGERNLWLCDSCSNLLLHLPWELEILVMTALVFCATDAAETSWNLGCLSLMALACLNPLNPSIKIQILICCPYMFSMEVVRRICWSIN